MARDELEHFRAFFLPKMAQVDSLILKKIESHVPLATDVARHLISMGGKRLRPLLCLAVADLFDYKDSKIIQLAACVEFIHTATLLHDDVVDESEKRRFGPTANALWGNKSAVLVGDFLFARSFELMVELECAAVLDVLARASSTMSLAEVRQLSALNDLSLRQEEYLKIIEGKTAVLFEAATHAAGLLVEASAPQVETLSRFGRTLGVIFQITDDFLDYGLHHAQGKVAGDDFREGKVTLPIILAYAQASKEEKHFWHRTMVEKKQTPEDFAQAQRYLKEGNVLHPLKDIVETYQSHILEEMNIFPQSPVLGYLKESLHYVAARAW